MPAPARQLDPAPEPDVGAERVTAEGTRITFNTDNSLICNADPSDVYISNALWAGWCREFDNHVVFGHGVHTVHRFYNNWPGRTSEEMQMPGVIAPFGQPAVEIQGNVLVDTDTDSSPTFVTGSGTSASLTNIITDGSVTSAPTQGISSGLSSGTAASPTEFARLQDFMLREADNTITVGAATGTNQWLGWERFSTNCGHHRIGPNLTEWNRMLGCRERLPFDLLPKSPTRDNPEWRQRRIERQNRRNTAEMRAEQLLWSTLDREQRREWRKLGWFHIQVGWNRYRIIVGRRVANVALVSREGLILLTYCCHTSERLPNADNALAQMMMLFHDEAGFLKKANVHYDRDRHGNTEIVFNHFTDQIAEIADQAAA